MSPERALETARGWRAALLLLVVASLGLRAVGIDFGIPVWEEPDAVIAMHVDKLRSGSERDDARWSDQNYPHLIAQLARLWPAIEGEERPDTSPGASLTVQEHLRVAAHTHLQVRWVVAWLSLLAIPGTWWLTRRCAGPGAAFAAAALVATSLLSFSFSQQGRPHAAASGLFVLAVVAAMRLTRRATLGDHVLAGTAAAAAVGVLQTGAFVLPALLCGFCLRPGAQGARRLFDPRALIHLALVAAAVRVFYPFLFGGQLGEDFGAPELEGGRVTMAEHSVAFGDFLDGGGFAVVLASLWNYDPILLVAACLGVLFWLSGALRSDRSGRRLAGPELVVALTFALPYLLVLGMFSKTYERFVIPLLPFLAAAAATGCAGWVAGPGARRVLRVGAAVALLVAAAACAKLAWLRSRPDTLDLAASWVEAQLDPTDPIAMPAAPRMNTSFDLPLVRREEELRTPAGKRIKQHSPWTRYQSRLEEVDGTRWALRWLAPRNAGENQLMIRDYEAFVLSLAPGHFIIEPFEERFDHALFVELRRTLVEHGELVARFTPEGPQGKIEWPFFYMLSDHFNDGGYENWPHFLVRLVRARSIGPAVEIYRVDG